MTIRGTAALIKNMTDLIDLANDYDDHAAATIVAKECEARGYNVSSSDIKSTLKIGRLLMEDGDLVSTSHSRAQERVPACVTRMFEDADAED